MKYIKRVEENMTYLNQQGFVSCECGSTNLALTASRFWKNSAMPQFSFICIKCSNRRGKPVHVGEFGTIEGLIVNAVGEEVRIDLYKKMFELLKLPRNSETGEVLVSGLKPVYLF